MNKLSNTSWVTIGGVALLIVVGLSTYAIQHNPEGDRGAGSSIEDQKQGGSEQAPPAEQWSTYENKEIGFSFQYPSDKREIRTGWVTGQPNSKIQAGSRFTGSLFTSGCGESCYPPALQFGSISRDFAAARGGGGIENFGYAKVGSDFYYAPVDPSRRITYKVEEVKTDRGYPGILIYNDTGKKDEAPVAIDPNQRIYLFNLGASSKFAALTFIFDLEQISLEDAEQVVSSFEISS